MIVDGIGVFNGVNCLNKRRMLREENLSSLADALKDTQRNFPIVVIISKENADGMMDEEWLAPFRVSDFTRTVWRYAHVYTGYETEGRRFLSMAGVDGSASEAVPRLYIFWPDGTQDNYGPEDVKNCSFGRHMEARVDMLTYEYRPRRTGSFIIRS